jgi:hypothetical protein
VRQSRSGRLGGKRRASRSVDPVRCEPLEPRTLLSGIVPEQLYDDASFTDARGDTVEVSVTGPTPSDTGFTVSLAGGATDDADINTINLLGLTDQNSLVIQVTPNALEVTSGGQYYTQMFSAGYVNVASITAISDPNFPEAAGMSDIGGIQLSAAVVNSITLPGVNIGNITVDTGEVPYVDRVNAATLASISISAPTVTATGSATLQEVVDENTVGLLSTYTPCTGLIGLYDIQAASITSLVINGATPLSIDNSFDQYDTMNDFEGTIEVTGAIGSIVAPRSALKGTIIAGSIGGEDIGIITGTLTTTDPTQPLTITLPTEFSGFLKSAGHLNLAFPQEALAAPEAGAEPATSMITGQITSGGGISGVDSTSLTDPIYVPDGYTGVVINTSTTSGISGIAINGIGLSQWYSASSIGDITANSFDVTFIAKAGTNIGDITSYATDIAGHFQAGGDIGNVTAAANVAADLIAGGNIGNITGITGGLTGNIIQAGGDIGNISVIQLSASTVQINAGGNIGSIYMYSGQWDGRVQAQNIGNITDASGNFDNAVFVAALSIGNVSVTAKTGDAISGGSIIAGTSIGNVAGYAFEGTGILGTLIQAGNQSGDQIASVTGISYGALTLPPITPGVTTSPAAEFNGLDSVQILAAAIGPILGQGYVGTGINQITVHAQVSDITSITGIGNGYGIYASTVVAEGGIGPISGQSTVQGDGINGDSFDANGTADPSDGDIGQITGQGGPAGGNGIAGTRFQATGAIAGISGTSNANGGNAIDTISTYATSYGMIDATVLGGQAGSGIVSSNFKAWSDYTNTRPTVQMAGFLVDVRSALGTGITDTIVNSKGDLQSISATALNAAAITGSSFTLSQGNFDVIYADSVNSGTAIDDSTFTANNGSITSATDQASVSTSGITALSGGSSTLANGIVGSTFTADGNIGFIYANVNGGTAIMDSTFTADSDFGNANNGPNLPDTSLPGDGDLGAILGISVLTSGQNLAASAGISGSTFTGEAISSINVDVTDREEGGAGITDSTFTASNAVYDGNGNFNNEGTIGAITVTDGSLVGNGIDTSQFTAGSGGSIGNITVTVLGGIGIYNSSFAADAFDFDQSNFDSTIGNITVNSGRATDGGLGLISLPPPPNNAWTLDPAGISTSFFAADAGINSVNVNSIGTGVFLSAFLANIASTVGGVTGYGIPGLVLPFLAPNVVGNIGSIDVTSTGRFGAGSVLSVYAGDNIGDINLQVASRSPNGTPISLPTIPGYIGLAFQFVQNLINYTITSVGPAASAGSMYVATNGNLGAITADNSGPGSDSLLSAYVALPFGFYGPVTNFISLVTQFNLFWGIPRLVGGGDGASSVSATSLTPPVASSYKDDDILNFKVNFSGPVDVTGQPTFSVQIGSTTRQALYQSGSGSSQLLFSLTIDPGDSGQLTIPSGTTIQTDIDNRIVDSSTGEDITSLSPTIGSTAGILIDTTAPTVTTIAPIASPSIKSGSDKYTVGELLSVLIVFDEAVYVKGAPAMALTIGKYARSLVYNSGSGTTTLRFTYKITRADVKAHEKATTDGLIELPGKSAITDLAGNDATLPSTMTTLTLEPSSGGQTVATWRKPKVAHATHRSQPALARRAIVIKNGLAFASKAQ